MSVDQSKEPGSLGMVIEARKEDGQKTVVSVHPEGPACAAGIGPGDVVVSVDGVSLGQLTLREACGYLRGPQNTDVALVMCTSSNEEEFVRIRRVPLLPVTPSVGLFFFPRRVSCMWVTSSGTRSVDSGPLTLKDNNMCIGRWQCGLDGEPALRVGPCSFLFTVQGHSFAVVFPNWDSPEATALIALFESKIATLSQYRSTLPGSQFNTPCPAEEVAAFVEALQVMDQSGRGAYYEALTKADPLFAAQIAYCWAEQCPSLVLASPSLAPHDGVEGIGRALGHAVDKMMHMTSELTAKQRQQLWATEEDGSSTQARRISTLSGALSEQLRSKAVQAEGWMAQRATELPVPRATEVAVPEDRRRALQAAATVTHTVVRIADTGAATVESMGRAVGTRIVNECPPPTDPDVLLAGEMAGATIGAVAETAFALRDAAIVLLSGARKAVVTVADRRYGGDFSGAVDQGLGVACNIGNTAISAVSVLRGKSLIKGVASSVAVHGALDAALRVGRGSELLQSPLLHSGSAQLQEVTQGPWIRGEVAIRSRALAVYTAGTVIHAAADGPLSRRESWRDSRGLDYDPGDPEVVMATPLGIPANNTDSGGWVLVDGFMFSAASTAAASPGGQSGASPLSCPSPREPLPSASASPSPVSPPPAAPILVLPLSIIKKVQVVEGPTFAVYVRDRAVPFKIQAASEAQSHQWVSTLISAAAAERQRLSAWARAEAGGGGETQAAAADGQVDGGVAQASAAASGAGRGDGSPDGGQGSKRVASPGLLAGGQFRIAPDFPAPSPPCKRHSLPASALHSSSHEDDEEVEVDVELMSHEDSDEDEDEDDVMFVEDAHATGWSGDRATWPRAQ